MVRGDKNAAVEEATQEGGEIDRIMKEIEDLEKKMDSDDATENDNSASNEVAKVLPLHPETQTAHSGGSMEAESMAETDAVPAVDEPLVKDNLGQAGDGALSLRVGGCAEISLEFARAGMTVTLNCTDEGLTISTDQGAEFRVPFKRAA